MSDNHSKDKADEKTGGQNPIEDFRDALVERLRSPVIGAYVIFFVVENWEIAALYLFPNSTLELIGLKKIGENAPLVAKEVNYWWPLLYTLLYLIFYPWLTEISSRYRSISRAIAATWGETLELVLQRRTAGVQRARVDLELQTVELASSQGELAEVKQRIIDVKKTIESEQTSLDGLRKESDDLSEQKEQVKAEIHSRTETLRRAHSERDALVELPNLETPIYVGNLDPEASVGDLQDLFSQFGDVVSTDKDRESAVVVMGEGAQKAISGLRGHELKGRPLFVIESSRRPQN